MRTPAAPSTSPRIPMERRQPPQDAAEVVALYDAFWFRRLVLRSYESHGREAEQAPVENAGALQRAPSSTGLRHRRTRSDEATAAAFDGLEPLQIRNSHRATLETILSGKDGLAAPLPQRRRPTGGRRRRRQRGRSMSELEFEEVKGLRDLGFTFSEDEVDAELASIVPGLRQRREEEDAAAAAESVKEVESRTKTAALASAPGMRTRRPYLSEAWEEEEEARTVALNMRIPAAHDGAALKEHLRLWAHTVASAVR